MLRGICWLAGSRKGTVWRACAPFLRERPGIRCFVEIEVTAEHFICAFTAQYHLDAHALDDAGKQVHRGGGAHGGHVVGLDVVDDITHGIQSLLDGIVDFVVYGTDVVGNFLGLGQVRGTFQSHGEAVELPATTQWTARRFRCGVPQTSALWPK